MHRGSCQNYKALDVRLELERHVEACVVEGFSISLLFFFEVRPLASDALLTTLHPLLENVITSKFLASELPVHGWRSPEIAWREIWTVWRMF
jgi:hypothetical protein